MYPVPYSKSSSHFYSKLLMPPPPSIKLIFEAFSTEVHLQNPENIMPTKKRKNLGKKGKGKRK